MKLAWKLSLSLAAAVVLLVAAGALTSEPANAILNCPSTHCSEVLDGWTYLGPCATNGDCLGWAYQRGSEKCHVSALGAN